MWWDLCSLSLFLYPCCSTDAPRPAVVQDQEVGYFHGFIDGVDYVFVDAPCFHAAAENIYGGSRQVSATTPAALPLSCHNEGPVWGPNFRHAWRSVQRSAALSRG